MKTRLNKTLKECLAGPLYNNRKSRLANTHFENELITDIAAFLNDKRYSDLIKDWANFFLMQNQFLIEANMHKSDGSFECPVDNAMMLTNKVIKKINNGHIWLKSIGLGIVNVVSFICLMLLFQQFSVSDTLALFILFSLLFIYMVITDIQVIRGRAKVMIFALLFWLACSPLFFFILK